MQHSNTGKCSERVAGRPRAGNLSAAFREFLLAHSFAMSTEAVGDVTFNVTGVAPTENS
jgi:hypothetical protein